MWKCVMCAKTMRREKKDQHECGKKECLTCKKMVSSDDHHCYFRGKSLEQPKTKFIFFDLETRQEDDRHMVNLCVAKIVCAHCIESPDDATCDVCGTRCSECHKKTKFGKEYARAPCIGCGKRTLFFSGKSALINFYKWLFIADHKGYTVLAHNLKGFDGVFLFDRLLDGGYDMNFIITGSKFMKINVKSNLNMTVIDSCNFLPMRLKEFSKTFGLDVLKGHFPFLFNTLSNQDYIGPVPDLKYFNPNGLFTKERAELIDWHQEKIDEGYEYNFQLEMAHYCEDDVRLLKMGCLKFREMMLEKTNGTIDPFNQITLAATCMSVFRTIFLKEYFVNECGEKVMVLGRGNNRDGL